MKILAIDPSTTRCGYCVLERPGSYLDLDTIEPHPSLDVHSRIFMIFQGLLDVAKAHNPTHLAIENAYVPRSSHTGKDGVVRSKANVKTAMIIAGVREVCIMVGHIARAELVEVHSMTAKKGMIGFLKLKKREEQKAAMIRVVQADLKLAQPPGEDEADAVAIGVAAHGAITSVPF